MAQSGHLGQFTALSCQIWQLEVHTLSQRLRCFPTESRAEIFPRRRQDCPLPQPINRVGFDDLREEKFGSKVSQKPAFSPNFCRFFFSSLSSHTENLPFSAEHKLTVFLSQPRATLPLHNSRHCSSPFLSQDFPSAHKLPF